MTKTPERIVVEALLGAAWIWLVGKAFFALEWW
jgi:hypothetical protein